ncbi:HTH-type transcriptional repressor CsiR (plasmid) [Sulfitobacter sp. THAF37]|uniref:GntR family transcriptional regulator n=1 Tax=Sulfitobacter sp. THAF37 TaxID=2587855 RepID=UPI0012696FA0|nr:GntR family transcriptional regulator [Sulfitobacter sp. THAF37]QFT60866.1 HTH-type transcriptional repressor CsiR [Sulfitobacter sp. THAF37]
MNQHIVYKNEGSQEEKASVDDSKRRILDIKRQPTVQLVADRLREAIIEGHFAIGEPLNEARLAQEFNVSRTPLREVFRILETERLLSSEPYRGVRVFTMDDEETEEITAFRIHIETIALREAAYLAKEPLLANLREVTARIETVVSAGQRDEFAALDTEFHDAFVTHAGNRYIGRAFDIFRWRFAALRHLLKHDEQVLERSCNGHRQIIEMIAQDRVDDACEILRDHIQNGKNRFMQSLKEAVPPK